MSTIEQQIELENSLVGLGVERYYKSFNKANAQNRLYITKVGKDIINVFVEVLAERIETFRSTKGTSKHGKHKEILRTIDPAITAYIVLKNLLAMDTSGKATAVLASEIGAAIDDELRVTKLLKKGDTEAYFKKLNQTLKEANSQSYKFKLKKLKAFCDREKLEHENLCRTNRTQLGVLLIELVMECSDLIEHCTIKMKRVPKGHRNYVQSVRLTADTLDWINNYNEVMADLLPVYKPCIIPPKDWESMYKGGFHTTRMQDKCKLIKVVNKDVKSFISQFDLSNVRTAINKLQQTCWQINKPVLDALLYAWQHNFDCGLPSKSPLEIPKFYSDAPKSEMSEETLKDFVAWKANACATYTAEKKRSGKALAIGRILHVATEYRDKLFWFVYQVDFRGRAYPATTSISPQGADWNKALLKFAKGKKLSDRGLYWLKVHTSNCYGVDKVSFDERIKWFTDNKQLILEVGKDPNATCNFWGKADKPFQFLAACVEYYNYTLDPVNFESCIPVGMDGTCNGLQHFSALLRDSTGGTSVNLVPNETPRDIYAAVASKATVELRLDTQSDFHKRVNAFLDKHNGLPRSIVKRSVMTLPYGVTQMGSRAFVQDSIEELDPEFLQKDQKLITYIASHIWSAIKSVVVSAPNAMNWLKEATKICLGTNLPMYWVSPIGMPVIQYLMKKTSRRIRTGMHGDLRLMIHNVEKQIDLLKQINGIAPNFVHSLDASHMMFTTIKAIQHDLDLSMIHDDYGTHAEDIDLLRDLIRETFVEMYTESCPLTQFKQELETTLQVAIPEIPAKGNLQILDVLKSSYFFH